MTAALADQDRLAAMAHEAWRRCAEYLSGDGFLHDVRIMLPDGVV